MKILTVGYNYPGSELPAGDVPLIGFKPDSALLRDGKPFFLPNFSSEIAYQLCVVVRIGRLGKCIAPRFAHRYYSEVTLGIDWIARDMQTPLLKACWSQELCRSFDNSATIGTFVPLDELGGDVQSLPFRLCIDGVTVCEDSTSQMIHHVDETLSYVSQYMTVKMGDLLFTGAPPSGIGIAKIGEHYEGYLGDRKVLDCHVR